MGAGGAPRPPRHGHPVTRQVLVPRDSYSIIDTWEAAGLRGSGSHDVVVEDVFVPHDHVTDLYGAGMRVDTALYRMPIYSRLAFNKVGVATGIARAALDAFAVLAADKTPFISQSLLRDRPQAQLAMAEAEARWRSARAFVLEAVDELWSSAHAGNEPTIQAQA